EWGETSAPACSRCREPREGRRMGKRRIAAIGRVAALAVGLSVIGAGPAWADNPYLTWNQPAATLLLPYFEVDLQTPGGPTTLFSINNASATAVLAHVVIWSDLAVPVFQFNTYLTGYDVVEVDLGQLIRNDVIPET